MYREPALRECGEEERRDENAERMVSANQRDRDSQEARTAGKTVLVVVLVAEDVIDSTHSRDHARQRERAHPNPAHADPSVFGSLGLEPDGA